MSSETVWRANSEVTETIQPSLLPGLQRATDPVGKPKVLHKGILLMYVESSSGFMPSAVFPSLPETDCKGEVIRMRLGSESVRNNDCCSILVPYMEDKTHPRDFSSG